MRMRIKSTETTLLILGIYQIIGALLGFYLVAKILLNTQEINGLLLLFFLVAIGLYSLSMKAGSVLIRKEYKRGLILSIINQFFQVIAIAIGGYKYDFFSGAKLSAGFNFTNGFHMKLESELISEFGFSWNSGKEYYIYVNLLAIVLMYIFMGIYEEMFKKKKDKMTIENSELFNITSNQE